MKKSGLMQIMICIKAQRNLCTSLRRKAIKNYSHLGPSCTNAPVPVGPVHLNSLASVDPRAAGELSGGNSLCICLCVKYKLACFHAVYLLSSLKRTPDAYGCRLYFAIAAPRVLFWFRSLHYGSGSGKPISWRCCSGRTG